MPIKVLQNYGVRTASGDAAASLVLGTGVSLIAFVCLIYLFSALALIVGLGLGSVTAAAILTASFAASGYIGTVLRPDLRWTVFAIMAAVIAGSVGLSLVLSDTTIDGQWYHFQAVAALAEGWNPYYETFRGAPGYGESGYSVWPQFYPHAHWLVMTLPLKLGLPLESSKFLQFTMALGAGMTAFAALYRAGLSLLLSLFAALALMSNPVTIVQIFTRMIDGLLASSLLAFGALAVLWVFDARKVYLGMMALVIAFAVGLKFTAVPILIAACAITLAAFWAARGLNASVQPAIVMFSAGAIGVLGFGFSPYVQNIIDFGHPFYPLMGDAGNTHDIITDLKPAVLNGRSGLSAFFFSLFSETHSGWAEGEPSLKLPFTLRPGEIYPAGAAEGQLGGFGPLFSGALVLSAILAVILFVQERTNPAIRIILGVALAIFTLTAVFPESWWARYAPHLWLVPPGIAVAGLLAKTRPSTYLALGMMAVLLVNSALVAASSLNRTFKRDIAVAAQIDRFASHGTEIVIDPEWAVKRISVLRSLGFDVRIESPIDPDSCALGEPIAAYGQDLVGGFMCIPNKE